MADTKRTKAALATLFADNTSGDISPADLRDYLESLDVSRAALYWTGFATTTLASQGTLVAGGTNRVKVLGATTSKTANRFSHDNNKLTYTGAPTIKADIFGVFSFEIDLANQSVILELYLNGAYLIGSYTPSRVAIVDQPWQMTIMGETNLATNDFVELYIANGTSAGKIITPHAGYLNIQEIPLG